MNRPVDWAPLAGSDPVPGDPDRVADLGRHYRKVAATISDAAAKLRRIAANYHDMDSDAVDAVRDNAQKVADDITRAHERYDGVGQALAGYAPHLRDAQSESAAALRQAKDAEAAQASASQKAEAAQARVDTATQGVDTTADQGDQRRALGAAEAAGDALTAARRRLDAAIETRGRAAQRAMGGINEVKNSGDLNDSWWDNWGAKVVKVIVTIADAVAVVAGILALISLFIPVIGPALAALFGTIALAAGLVSLAGNLALASTGYAEWSAVMWSVAGVLSFGVGRAAVAALKVSVKGARGAARMAAGRWAGQSPAVRGAAGLSQRSSSKAIKEMLGTRTPMSKNAAKGLVKASAAQKYAPSFAEFGRSLRAMPGEFAENLQTVRSAGLSGTVDALRQTPQHVQLQAQQVMSGDGVQALLRAGGEAPTAAGLDDLGRVSDTIRSGAEVGEHMKYVKINEFTFTASILFGAGDTARGTAEFVGDLREPSPAEQLHLPATAEASQR
ncbi:MAG: hypothetical protein GEU83_14295 [Pseudonocardiaceae bacterium]|nr:hypothetical protein [Pseudonocardiaceae bacterium]